MGGLLLKFADLGIGCFHVVVVANDGGRRGHDLSQLGVDLIRIGSSLRPLQQRVVILLVLPLGLVEQRPKAVRET